MKKFELSAYGVEEMNQKEQQNIDGGAIITIAALTIACKWLLGACAAGIAADIILNPGNTADQFNEGYHSVRN